MTRSGGLSDISGSLPFGCGPHYPGHHRLAAPVARPAARTIFGRLASDGGAPAPRRPAARTTRSITDSPRRRTPRLALPCPLQLAADVLHGDAAHDRAAVGAEVGGARLAEVADEALHLLARQRRVGLDRAATRHERERALHRRHVGLGPAQLVHRRLQQAPWLI